MSVSLRNTSGVAREVNGRVVDIDEQLEVDGDLAAKKDQPADGYLIGDSVWPKAHWTASGDRKVKES